MFAAVYEYVCVLTGSEAKTRSKEEIKTDQIFNIPISHTLHQHCIAASSGHYNYNYSNPRLD